MMNDDGIAKAMAEAYLRDRQAEMRANLDTFEKQLLAGPAPADQPMQGLSNRFTNPDPPEYPFPYGEVPRRTPECNKCGQRHGPISACFSPQAEYQHKKNDVNPTTLRPYPPDPYLIPNALQQYAGAGLI